VLWRDKYEVFVVAVSETQAKRFGAELSGGDFRRLDGRQIKRSSPDGLNIRRRTMTSAGGLSPWCLLYYHSDPVSSVVPNESVGGGSQQKPSAAKISVTPVGSGIPAAWVASIYS
jgi:hypothetical protein